MSQKRKIDDDDIFHLDSELEDDDLFFKVPKINHSAIVATIHHKQPESELESELETNFTINPIQTDLFSQIHESELETDLKQNDLFSPLPPPASEEREVDMNLFLQPPPIDFESNTLDFEVSSVKDFSVYEDESEPVSLAFDDGSDSEPQKEKQICNDIVEIKNLATDPNNIYFAKRAENQIFIVFPHLISSIKFRCDANELVRKQLKQITVRDWTFTKHKDSGEVGYSITLSPRLRNFYDFPVYIEIETIDFVYFTQSFYHLTHTSVVKAFEAGKCPVNPNTEKIFVTTLKERKSDFVKCFPSSIYKTRSNEICVRTTEYIKTISVPHTASDYIITNITSDKNFFMFEISLCKILDTIKLHFIVNKHPISFDLNCVFS